MTAILSAWMAEVVFESFGAILYRSRSPLLSAILAFCALTDVSAFALTGILPATWIYFWAAWGQFCLKELMLIWLGCAICGMFAKGHGMSKSQGIIAAGMMSLFVISFTMVFAFNGHTLKERLLAGEITADTILLLIVAVALISGTGKRLPHIWQWITAGFLVMVGTDMLFTIGWFSAETIRHWYPAGRLLAYAVWCVGPLRAVKLPECRADLAKRYAEVERVTVI